MKGRGCMVWILSILLVLALLIVWSVYTDRNNYTYYKMTVEVETPEGVRSGHSVREVHYGSGEGWSWLPIWWLGEQRPQWRLRGEAVAINIAPGQTLFALLSSGSGQVDYAGRDVWQMLKDESKIKGGKLELWPNMPTKRGLNAQERQGSTLPMLVTLSDLADPKSVALVNPADLAASFGEGVKLSRIIVEVTDEALTVGIGKRLGWLDDPGYSLNKGSGVTASPTLSQSIRHGAFSQGMHK